MKLRKGTALQCEDGTKKVCLVDEMGHVQAEALWTLDPKYWKMFGSLLSLRLQLLK